MWQSYGFFRLSSIISTLIFSYPHVFFTLKGQHTKDCYPSVTFLHAIALLSLKHTLILLFQSG